MKGQGWTPPQRTARSARLVDLLRPGNRPGRGITRITVRGFKSIADEQAIEIRPLTILAGANSSGKSSMLQPLLLLKQTLEAGYDPGPLLLDGPNVRFTSADQVLSSVGVGKKGATSTSFDIGIEISSESMLTIEFGRPSRKGLELQKMSYREGAWELELQPNMIELRSGDLLAALFRSGPKQETIGSLSEMLDGISRRWSVVRNRCFLEITPIQQEEKGLFGSDFTWSAYRSAPTVFKKVLATASIFDPFIRDTIHIPGFRGNPARTYPLSATGPAFPGTFEHYVASIIARWQTEGNRVALNNVGSGLRKLGLTWRVRAQPISETQVELRVARLRSSTRGGASEMVSIADVGFGVSQVLPVLVALEMAAPGQLVYVEQPELHLHPRAQYALAGVLADAARRGVKLVVESHSSVLIQGVQALVAEGRLSTENVKLHWFRRRETGLDAGSTEVISADLDEAGAFGDWPEDFADVSLMAESRYLDAAESRRAASVRE